MSNKIDSRIYLPPVAGYEYLDDVKETEYDSADDSPVLVTAPQGLQPPSSVNVIEHVYRKGADGRTLVDIVIEVEDMPGATEYEVRTAVA